MGGNPPDERPGHRRRTRQLQAAVSQELKLLELKCRGTPTVRRHIVRRQTADLRSSSAFTPNDEDGPSPELT